MGEYTIGAVEIFDDVPTGYAMNLTSLDLSSGAEASDDGAGELYATGQSLTGFAPVASFTTKNLAALLGLVGLNGQCIGQSGEALTQADIYSRKLETCKSALGATPHMRHRVTTGLLRLGTLSMPRGGDATLSAMLDTFTDGTNAPVGETDGVALPTGIISTRYTLGLSEIAGVLFQEIDSIELAFNVGISDKSPRLGAIWPDSAGVLTVRPVLTLRGRDLSRVKSTLIKLGANQALHTNTTIQLIKRATGTSFVPFPTAEHIAITLAGLVVPETLVSSSAGGRATNEIVLAAAFDGTNAPVLINTAIAYNAALS